MGAGRVSIEPGQRENPQVCRKITSFPVPIALPCDSCFLGDSKNVWFPWIGTKWGLLAACQDSPTHPQTLVLGLDSDLATRLSQELACVRGPPASILWNRACPPSKSLSPSGLGERWGISKWGWVGLALELMVGTVFVEGGPCFCSLAGESKKTCVHSGESRLPPLYVFICWSGFWIGLVALPTPRQSHRQEKQF